jgi:Rrf2 family protein
MSMARAAPNRDGQGYAPMLTKKGKYGLKALSALAALPPDQLAFVGGIAEANNIPRKFLDAILSELRNAGFVQSRKGKAGGYGLARAPEEIMIGHVVRVLDGPLAPIPCASKTRYQPCADCDVETCNLRRLMLEVRNAMAEILDHTSLAQFRGPVGASLMADDDQLTA